MEYDSVYSIDLDILAAVRQGGGGGGSVQIVQETGQSTTAVMSQKAVTDALEGAGGGSREIIELVGGQNYIDVYNYASGLINSGENLGKLFDKYIFTANVYGVQSIRPTAYQVDFLDNALHIYLLTDVFDFKYSISADGNCGEVYKNRLKTVNGQSADGNGNVNVEGGGKEQIVLNNGQTQEEYVEIYNNLLAKFSNGSIKDVEILYKKPTDNAEFYRLLPCVDIAHPADNWIALSFCDYSRNNPQYVIEFDLANDGNVYYNNRMVISDAQGDGKTYGRCDNSWVEIQGISAVYLTQEEYDALAVKDSNTLYVIIEHNVPDFTQNISNPLTQENRKFALKAEDASSVFYFDYEGESGCDWFVNGEEIATANEYGSVGSSPLSIIKHTNDYYVIEVSSEWYGSTVFDGGSSTEKFYKVND